MNGDVTITSQASKFISELTTNTGALKDIQHCLDHYGNDDKTKANFYHLGQAVKHVFNASTSWQNAQKRIEAAIIETIMDSSTDSLDPENHGNEISEIAQTVLKRLFSEYNEADPSQRSEFLGEKTLQAILLKIHSEENAVKKMEAALEEYEEIDYNDLKDPPRNRYDWCQSREQYEFSKKCNDHSDRISAKENEKARASNMAFEKWAAKISQSFMNLAEQQSEPSNEPLTRKEMKVRAANERHQERLAEIDRSWADMRAHALEKSEQVKMQRSLARQAHRMYVNGEIDDEQYEQARGIAVGKKVEPAFYSSVVYEDADTPNTPTTSFDTPLFSLDASGTAADTPNIPKVSLDDSSGDSKTPATSSLDTPDASPAPSPDTSDASSE